MRIWFAGCVLALVPAAAYSQSMVEYGALAGSTSTAAAGAGKSTASALSKTLGKLDAALAASSSTEAVSRDAVTQAKASPPAKPLPKPALSAFDGIKAGTPRADLIARAGKPEFAIATSEEEVLRYTTSDGGQVRIRVVDGKVAAIDRPKPAPEKPKEASTEIRIEQ
jgi:hypothetical protein